MKRRHLHTIPLVARLLLASLSGGICILILAAPLLADRGFAVAAAWVNALFSSVCHQDAARSFAILGHSWAVCHRCSGICFGVFAVSLLPFEFSGLLEMPRRRRAWVVAGAAPLLLDFALSFAGIWSNTAASRFVTGLIFGGMLSSLMAPALAELMREAPRHRRYASVDAGGGLA
ncbi:MAG: putative rane protein [Acidobacteria bacterium]|nr:putative rane protein [Acidobacteriota bacterium]